MNVEIIILKEDSDLKGEGEAVKVALVQIVAVSEETHSTVTK
jgi:hypothetical protein